jgi:predicted metallopeptidase
VFELAAPIQIPAKCKGAFRHNIPQRKGERSEEIYKQIVAVNGNVMNSKM